MERKESMTTSLQDQIKILIKLQVIDTQIYQLDRENELIPNHKSALDEAFTSTKAGMDSASTKYKKMQVEAKEHENDIASRETLIAKLQNQQGLVKTNQEYSAIAHEIGNALADKSISEDQALKLLDEIDVQKKLVDEEKANLAKEEDNYNKIIAESDSRVAAIAEERLKLSAERTQHLSGVEDELLERYNNIIQKRDGVAIVPVSGESCTGCSMNLPPQIINEVKLKEDLVVCESCSRILFEAE
ncbi:MAG: putative nucleic acid-binding Zn-ribbon protein [Candidatus Omnitrophota bacterium]|jgi:predicted  nucleic acid-binding Zn-ribbon protein